MIAGGEQRPPGKMMVARGTKDGHKKSVRQADGRVLNEDFYSPRCLTLR